MVCIHKRIKSSKFLAISSLSHIQPMKALPCMSLRCPPHLPSHIASLLTSHSFPHIPYPFSLLLPLFQFHPPPSLLPLPLSLSMATTSIQYLCKPLLHHHHHSFTTPDTSLQFLKHLTTTTNNSTTLKLFSSLSSSPTTTTSLTPSTNTSPFDTLAEHLAAANFRQADEETRRLLIELAGEAAQKRGYVFFSEVQFISAADLRAIDRLWRRHSGDRFGYSVQRRIWERKERRDFTGFFIRVGWMKKLDTEMEQYNYRAFPDEFIWELADDTPEGHLPLTNALRGTQLLMKIFTHPAFEEELEEEKGEEKDEVEGRKEEVKQMPKFIKSFKQDYSF